MIDCVNKLLFMKINVFYTYRVLAPTRPSHFAQQPSAQAHTLLVNNTALL